MNLYDIEMDLLNAQTMSNKLHGQNVLEDTILAKMIAEGYIACFLQVLLGENCKEKWRKLNLQNGEFCRCPEPESSSPGFTSIHQCLQVT